MLQGAPSVGLAWIPSPQTSVWMIQWLLTTIATSVNVMVRHELLTLNIKYMIPYCVLIPLPSIVIGIFAALGWQWPRTNEGWQITILNSGTFILSTINICSPPRWRYDPSSPAAPLTGAKFSDLDQATILVVGLFALIPTFAAIVANVCHSCLRSV